MFHLKLFSQGVQIANEGSTADRNQITQQLQSLKTQILTLKRAIDKKREEHIKSVAEHNKVYCTLDPFGYNTCGKLFYDPD